MAESVTISVTSPLLSGPVEVKVLVPPGLELDAEALEFLRARCEAAVYDSWRDFLDKFEPMADLPPEAYTMKSLEAAAKAWVGRGIR